jgi:hypothetical protein
MVTLTEFVSKITFYHLLKHKKTELQMQFGFHYPLGFMFFVDLVHTIHAARHSTRHCWSFVFFLFN